MADAIKLVAGDNLPTVTLILTDDSTGLPVDMSAATTTAAVKFRAAGTTTVLATLPCSNVTNGADGKVKFSFPAGALNVAEGMYEGEIEISFNGLSQTVYDLLKFKVRAHF